MEETTNTEELENTIGLNEISEVKEEPVKVDEAKREDKKAPKKKKHIGRIIGNLIFAIIAIFIIFEAVIGIINMKLINEQKDPVWYLNSSKREENDKTITEYNLGLYRIVQTDTEKDTRIVLKLFFIKD